VFYVLPPAKPACTTTLDQVLSGQAVGSGAVKCQLPASSSHTSLPLVGFNIYLRAVNPDTKSDNGNILNLRVRLAASILGSGPRESSAPLVCVRLGRLPWTTLRRRHCWATGGVCRGSTWGRRTS
jgi:hypothetical protein